MVAESPSLARSTITVVERIARAIAVISTLLLMLVTGVDVFMRAVLGRGFPGAVELTEVMLVVAVYLGMMTASLDGMHIRATLVTGMLSPPMRRLTRVAGSLVAIAITGWLVYGSLLRAVTSYARGEYRFGLAQVPIWPARIAIVVGLVGLLVALVLHAIEIARREPDEELPSWKP